MAHKIFAVLVNNKIVELGVWDDDSASYSLANEFAKIHFGSNAMAIDVTDYPVAVEDSYVDGEFYRNMNGESKKIDRIPTYVERLDLLEQKVKDIEKMLEEFNNG